MTNKRKLSRAQVSRLGGLASADSLGDAGRRRRAAKGGNATVEKHGRAHMARLALLRHGYKVAL